MFRRRTRPDVKAAALTNNTVVTLKKSVEIDSHLKVTEPHDIVPFPDVNEMDTAPGSISAYTKRGICEGRALSGCRNEWPVHRYLKMIIGSIKQRRLVGKHPIFAVGVPPHYEARMSVCQRFWKHEHRQCPGTAFSHAFNAESSSEIV